MKPTPLLRSNWEKVNVKRDPTLKIGCTFWERGSRVGMTGVFYSRDARLSISSSPMIVWVRSLFSCILQATSSKLLWYQAIFIVGIIHIQLPSSKFNMPILCAQSLRLPSSKFKMPILCPQTQTLRLPSPKFKGPILSTLFLLAKLLSVRCAPVSESTKACEAGKDKTKQNKHKTRQTETQTKQTQTTTAR